MIEILQTIWSSLTTENLTLTNYICIPLAFIEAYVSMLLFTTLLNINSDKKSKIYYVIIVSVLGIISKHIIPNPYNALFTFSIMFLSILLIFKTNIFKGLACLIFSFIIEALLESVFANVYYEIFHVDYLIGGNIPLHRLIGNLCIYLIMFLICIVLKHFKLNISKFEILDKKKRVILIINMICALILIASQVYVTYFYSTTLPLYIALITIFSLLVYFLISVYSIVNVTKLETTSMSLEEATLYNKTLQMLQDNTRAFRHDFSNIVQGMAGFIDKNDMEGLKKYYSQLLEDIQHTNNLTTLSPEVVNNPAIYNVLATKYHKADQLGIKINLEAFLNMNDLHIKIYEFTRVLGILMDNAIEAAKECDEKIINVRLRKDSRRHMQLLIIENTYTNKDINTDKIFDKGYSTKKGNSGLGLWEVRQILRKNNNLNLFTTKNDEFFTQQFEIFY